MSRRFRFALEWVLVLLPVFFVAQDWLRYDTATILVGHEMEWLTGHVTLASDALRETGRIPRWNPYYNTGEPLLDNAFSFVMNPLSSLPTLLAGGVQGIKWSSAFYVAFAALGGWYCGYAMGLNGVGRVFLGWLLLFKGNQQMMLRTGYFQLAVQQAYFGWILGGAIEVLRTRKRYAVVLTALMVMLMFWAGNVWYILPVLVMLTAVTLSEGVLLRNTLGLRRMALAGVLTLALGAAYIVPVVQEQPSIARHAPEKRAGWEIQNPLDAYALYVRGDYEFVTEEMTVYDPHFETMGNGWLNIHYSFVVPFWFVVLVVGAVLYGLLRHRVRWRYNRITGFFIAAFQLRNITAPRQPMTPQTAFYLRFALIGGVMIVLMTLWGMGGTSLFVWLYEQFPLLGQWRFVGRALAMGSFWVAILTAIMVHWLWMRASMRGRGALLLGCALVLIELGSFWGYSPNVIAYHEEYDACLADLRAREGEDAFLTVEYLGYNIMTSFLKHKVRHWSIEADFYMIPEPNTLGWVDDFTLARENPPYYLVLDGNVSSNLVQDGQYLPDRKSLPSQYTEQCLWAYTDKALPHAFSIGAEWQQGYADLPAEYWGYANFITPVTALYREYDTIALVVEGNAKADYVLVMESAFRGWQATLNGERVPLEIIGGMLALKVPQDGQLHQILFEYRPQEFIIGAFITLVSAVGCVIALLLPRRHHRAPVTENAPSETT